MDYELLKIGKVLPMLNSPSAHQLRQEITKKSVQSRQIKQEFKPTSPKSPLRCLITQQGGVPRPKKELKISQAKSFDGFPQEKFTAALEEYKTLETHLKKKKDPLRVLGDLFERSPKRNNTRHLRMTSTEASFYKKSPKSPNESGSSPSNAMTSGNFVFPKKQVLLREASQFDHIYQYSLGTGFTVLTDDALGLNGKKVSLGEIKQKQIIRQQKKFVKDWKVDPMAAFQSPYKDLEEISKNVQGLVSPHQQNQKLRHRGGQRAQTLNVKIGTQWSTSESPLKMKTALLDRTTMYSFDGVSQPQTWNLDSPLKLKSAF